ncbi:MAG: phosphoribosyltransferase [Firmicutes bacterium]|nr:phosphoribosyltransferase [Bacillota bacterium]
MRKWWAVLLDWVFPPRCPVCRLAVDSHGLLCPQCLAGISRAHEINVVIRRLVALDGCQVLCDYAGGVKFLISGMKFCQKAYYAVHLRRLLMERLDVMRLPDVDVVVPVPLHITRLKERGFNQTTLVFEKWAKHYGILWSGDMLARVKATAPQWTLVAKERRKNVKDAFVLTRPDWAKGKRILLVDDIITTGFTMNECAKTLKKGGAIAVFGLALAGGGDGC